MRRSTARQKRGRAKSPAPTPRQPLAGNIDSLGRGPTSAPPVADRLSISPAGRAGPADPLRPTNRRRQAHPALHLRPPMPGTSCPPPPHPPAHPALAALSDRACQVIPCSSAPATENVKHFWHPPYSHRCRPHAFDTHPYTYSLTSPERFLRPAASHHHRPARLLRTLNFNTGLLP